MTIIDGHCDALWKMFERPELDFFNPLQEGLEVDYAKMIKADIKIQFFAIYVSEKITHPRFEHYLEYINIFYQKIVNSGNISLIKNQADLSNIMHGQGRGAILTLEGADALENNSIYTQTLYHLGVRMIGITWNYGNWAADGILEPRQGGFSRKGKRFVKQCNELGIMIDVSHLSARSFWDVSETSTKPFVATHSNAKAVCSHPRNLDDEQIRNLIEREGRIGLTFVPWFISAKGDASIDGLRRHMEHIGELGGEKHLVLGSDFDGVDQWIPGLEHAGMYDQLAQHLSKHYKDEWIKDVLSGNWYRFLQSNLPDT